MIPEPPCGDGVDHLPFAIYFVYDNQRPFVCVFETVVCAERCRDVFAMQKNRDACAVLQGVDIDVLDFAELSDEFVPLEKYLDCFIACVAEEGHE